MAVVSRLCIDQLRSARRRREEYVGVWLPEPVRTDETLIDTAELNGRTAIPVYENDALTNAILFDAVGDEIRAIYLVRNPDKLRRLATSL